MRLLYFKMCVYCLSLSLSLSHISFFRSFFLSYVFQTDCLCFEKMSYIVYCCHFPIAVLLKYTSANTCHELIAELKAGGIAASFAAGVAIVEPFCRKKDAVSDRKFMCGVFCVWLGFLLFATFGASRGGVRYSDFMPTDDGGVAGPGTALGSSCAFNSGGGGSTPGHVIFKLVNTSASQVFRLRL